MNRTLALMIVALIASRPVLAEEIIIVDPYGAVTTPTSPAGRDPQVDRRTGADRARAWSSGAQGRTPQGTLVILPPGSGDATVLVTPSAPTDARGAAREAINRAGDHARGEGAGPVEDASGQAIIIIDDGQIRAAADTAAADTAARAKLNAAKARGYSQGHKPCGSVVVGGIGEAGQTSGSTVTKDVYVVNSNCR